MDKRMTRTDYVFAILTIFMIVCVIGAFFIGFNIGSDRTEARYQKMMAAATPPPEEPGAYAQQTVVSFYHNMYLPFREFQDEWFRTTGALETNVDQAARAAAVKNLLALAEDRYSSMKSKNMPVDSPLLTEAHGYFTSSLQGFAEALKDLAGKAANLSGEQFVQAVQTDEKLNSAKKAALQGQRSFYLSMVKWYETIDPNVQPSPSDKVWTVEEWSNLPLLVKNQYVADRMVADQSFRAFLPQDMTVRIDDLIATGQSSKLDLKNVPAIIQLLNGTDAVRNGDYLKKAGNRYADQVYPDLPFFKNEAGELPTQG